MNETIGYAAASDESVSPLFCIDCAEEVTREVEPRTEADFENFDSATCILCETTFYTDTELAGE